MRKIGFEIKNYKRIKELNVPLSECDVVIVSGKNMDGKSSLINGIFENLTLKNLSNEPLSRGASSGEKSVIIEDKNGKEIKIVHTFEKKSPMGSFYAIQDGKKIASVEKIRELIGECNKYTIYDFFVMCRSTDGRRKFISEILMKMLNKEQSDRIEEINKEINTKNGLTYIKRRDANRALETLNNTPMLTKEEEETLTKEEAYKATIKETNDTIELANKNLSLVVNVNSYIFNIPGSGLSSSLTKEQITFKSEELKTLLQTIIDSETRILEYKEIINNQEAKLKQVINDAKNNESYKTALQALLDIDKIKYKKESFVGIKSQIDALTKEIEGLNKKLSDMSEEKDAILNKSNLPEGLVIETESDFTYNGFNFSENDISESEAQLLLAKLTIPIYDGPYFRMGNADIYGKNALAELTELAAKHGKILAMERVNDDLTEVFVECTVYDEDSENITQNKPGDKIFDGEMLSKRKEELQTNVEVVESTIPAVEEKKESTGNKLLREAEANRAKRADNFVDNAIARGVDIDNKETYSEKVVNPLAVDFTNDVKAYEEGEKVSVEPEQTTKEVIVNPVTETATNKTEKVTNVTDNDIKKLNDLF